MQWSIISRMVEANFQHQDGRDSESTNYIKNGRS